MRTTRLFIILLIIAGLLLIPFIAMQFSEEVVWTSSDFIIMGILLFAVGLLINLVLLKIKSSKNKIILCGIILAAFFLLYAEISVGIFGSPIAGS